MKLDLIEELDLARWEDCLRAFSASPLLASPWIEAFRNEYRQPIYLRLAFEGKTLGLAAGLRIETPNVILRKLYRSLSFFSGPAVSSADPGLSRMCIARLIEFAREKGFTHLEWGTWDYPVPLDLKGLPLKTVTTREYILDMRESLPELRKKIRKRMQQYVRVAERAGLTFQECESPDILDNLVSLLKETKSARLSKNYPEYSYYYVRYFDDNILHKLFQNRIARSFCIKKEDRVLCASLDAIHNKKAYSLLIGANQEGYKSRAPALLHAKLIEKLKSEGIEYLNLGAVGDDPSDEGLVFFKTSFGAREYITTGGRTSHLQSPVLSRLLNLYEKLPKTRIQAIINKKLRGRTYR